MSLIDPGIDLLGLQHMGKLFLDLAFPFGFCLGTLFFSKITDTVRFIISKHGHNALLMQYIDDLIYCILQISNLLLDSLQELGLDISTKRLCPPDTKVICLGIQFDIDKSTISIPDKNIQELCQVIHTWSYKRVSTKNEGYFLNRMLQLLRDNSHNKNIELTQNLNKFQLTFPLNMGI